MKALLVIAALLAAIMSVAEAALPPETNRPFLHPLFTDHAVLQRDRPVPVWGWAAPGTEVKITYAGRALTGKARAEDGLWVVQLPAEPAGDARSLVIEGGPAPITLNVLRGDVWLCSGQSNMAWATKDCADKEQILADPVPAQISVYTISIRRALRPGAMIDPQFKWQPATPEAILKTSAVGYTLGRELHRALNVPLGIIVAAQGGTSIEAWMADSGKPVPAAGSPEEKELLSRPGAPSTVHYFGMIHPIMPYPLAGVAWYQGEQNVGAGVRYKGGLTMMIDQWRAGFRSPDLPFVIVQLPNYIDRYPQFSPWAALREGQRLAVEATPRAGLVPTIDLGDPRDIHPRNKHQVGWRAAQVALKIAYKRADVEASGPVFDKAEFSGNSARVTFKNLGAGFEVRGRMPYPFELAGADGAWSLANTEIVDGNTVVVSGKVNNPTQVRYAWADAPIVTLFGKNGWPVPPFTSVDLEKAEAK